MLGRWCEIRTFQYRCRTFSRVRELKRPCSAWTPNMRSSELLGFDLLRIVLYDIVLFARERFFRLPLGLAG